MKNYYSILNLPRAASQAEIKKAYRLLAVEHHPDKNAGDSGSEERFKEISEAYIVLGDVAKRNAYDFAKGYQHDLRQNSTTSGGQTPATFLMLFKKVKNRVFHAGGYVNKAVLFKIIDDLLSEESVEFLVKSGDRVMNGLILDEVLVSCMYLSEPDRSAIFGKLHRIADGHPHLISKIEGIKNIPVSDKKKSGYEHPERPTMVSIVIFVVVLIIILAMLA